VKAAGRVFVAGVLVAVGAISALVSWGPLQNVVGDGKGDSQTSDYLLFGLPFVAVSLGCLIAAVYMLRPRR